MPKIKIDGKEVEFNEGMTVLQACELAGAEIPRFCYHEKLSIAGNCRMCLVEMERSPKPIASCAMPASEGMVIRTNSEVVKKAREGVMEFLLINHPLDCPICDQGGECDLQDQAMAYGRDGSRFHENKRTVEDKDFGPLIKAHMTRCIHCTRCIRFSEDVAGIEELGAVYRGEDMQVGTYVEKSVSSELSGNMIDLCPVGALTSKPYAFKARSWELEKTESIDVMDAVGSNIRVDSRGVEVMRILPIINDDINEEWISDKTRFAYDGLKAQRLDRPYVKKNGKLTEASWDEAFEVVAEKLKKIDPKHVGAIAGDMADVESMAALKELMGMLGSKNIDCRQRGEKFTSGNRSSYVFNPTIAGIDKADFCLIVGANPRHDATILNARIRKNILKGKIEVVSIGPAFDLTYKVENLGDNLKIIDEIISGKHAICKKIKKASNPMLIVGTNVLSGKDGAKALSKLQELASIHKFVKKDWNGFGVLQKTASMVGGLDIGFTPQGHASGAEEMLKGNMKFVYLLGADEIDPKKLGKAFIVYQGHHGDVGAHVADVILPGAAYTEKQATYINLEGRAQRTQLAVSPPGLAREDCQIIMQLGKIIDKKYPYLLRDDIIKSWKVEALKKLWEIVPAEWQAEKPAGGGALSGAIKMESKNYYMTDPISRASKTMAACTKAFANSKQMETA